MTDKEEHEEPTFGIDASDEEEAMVKDSLNAYRLHLILAEQRQIRRQFSAIWLMLLAIYLMVFAVRLRQGD